MSVFGRRKDDEDPFAALKDGVTYQSGPTTAADLGLGTGASGLGEAQQPTRSPGNLPAPAILRASHASARRSPGPSIGAASLWRVVIAVCVIGLGVIPLLKLGQSTHSIKGPTFNFGAGEGSGANGFTPSAPSSTSYLTSAGVRAGLHQIAHIAPHARLSLLRLDANSLSTTAVLSGGRAKLIYFGPSGTFVASAHANASERPVPLSQIKPGALTRLMSGMRHRYQVPGSRIDYIVLSSLPGQAARWIVFAKTHGHPGYSASLDGTAIVPL